MWKFVSGNVRGDGDLVEPLHPILAAAPRWLHLKVFGRPFVPGNYLHCYQTAPMHWHHTVHTAQCQVPINLTMFSWRIRCPQHITFPPGICCLIRTYRKTPEQVRYNSMNARCTLPKFLWVKTSSNMFQSSACNKYYVRWEHYHCTMCSS